MIKVHLKYLIRDRGRYYVRKPRQRKIRIRETYEDADGRITPEFMKAYFAALDRQEVPKTPREKTFYWLVDQYYRSPKFKGFDSVTQADKRRVLDHFCKTAGNLPYAALRKTDVEASQQRRSDTPAAADKFVKQIRSLFVWAIKNNHATFNPAAGVEMIHNSDGWHTWTSEEIAIYRAYHPMGTKARLALEIMLNVGARISDACRIGRQHEVDGRLKFVAWKGHNKTKTRRTIDVPIQADLALARSVAGHTTYLINDLGRSFTAGGLGVKFREWCDAAGLPQCSAHGLRKASAVMFAEHGATAPELCAIFGWAKLETAEIYLREANKRQMTTNAFARLEEYRARKSVSISSPNSSDETKKGNNGGKSKPE